MAAQALTTGKIAVILYENALETFETNDQMLDKVDFWMPDKSDMQNSDNTIWRTVEQHAPVIAGWDMANLETGIIEETYPAVLGTPQNDYVEMRADKLRDPQFWKQRGVASGRRQASNLNSAIALAMVQQGGMYFNSTTTSGYNFVSEAQTLMNERQLVKDQRNFLFNDRDSNFFSQDLAARQTLQGRPNDTWRTGQIGQNVAEFDLFVGSYLPNLAGGASPATTVTGNQSFKPEGGTVDPVTDEVLNVDYRKATVVVAASASYNIGDKIQFVNGSTPVYAVGLDDKTVTATPMTFTVVGKPNGTSLQIMPKPIALDDSGLTTLEKAYANINTQILNGAVVQRLNTETLAKTNLYWNQDAVEVLGGSVPANLFNQFGGKQVIESTMKNGQPFYMLYDGNIEDMTFRFRLFTWYGITIRNPSAVGIAERRAAT